MNKTSIFLSAIWLFLWAIPAPSAFADTDDSTPVVTSPSSWYLGLGLGIDEPTMNWNTDYPLGGGGDILVGYRFNPTLSLQLALTPWFFTGGGTSVCDVRVSPELRLANPIQNVTPYILAGPGYDLQFKSPAGYFTSTMAAVFGLGFEFNLRPGEHAFVEGRYYFLIYNNVLQQNAPVLIGLSEDL